MNEIRIYYESLEQAESYILPLVKKGINCEVTKVSLIKSKKGSFNYSRTVAPIIYWKDPDILITLVKEGKEHPLCAIEFSSAVFTEDHELQRFDGIVAAANNNCIYVKISPNQKKSQSGKHGGNINFNYLGPYSAILNKFGKTCYHFNWKCDINGNVLVNSNNLSCPEDLEEFETFITSLVQYVHNKDISSNGWTEKFGDTLLTIPYFKEWREKLKKCADLDVSILKTSRTTWSSAKEELVLKLNRFGHAMDPERGMLAYYGTIFSNVVAKMSFSVENTAWYKSVTAEKKISEYLNKKGLKNAYDYLYSFVYGSGLYQIEEVSSLLKSYEKDTSEHLEINLTSILTNNYASLNKSMRTIFKYSQYLIITDSEGDIKVKLYWDSLKIIEDYSTYPSVTSIEPRQNLDEDDVTYITIHNILKPNGYKILASSYPGAQGDRVALVAPGTGRAQPRSYIDIIAYLPKKHTMLQENKGVYSRTEIQNTICKLEYFKSKKEYTVAISTFMNKYVSNPPNSIKIGVGFWANSSFNITKISNLDLGDLDYFIYIHKDMDKWSIWSNGKNNLFKITNGIVRIPQIFEISGRNENRTRAP